MNGCQEEPRGKDVEGGGVGEEEGYLLARETQNTERLTLIHLLRQQLQAWSPRQILISNHELIKGGLVGT